MEQDSGPVIDMTPDGRFAKPSGGISVMQIAVRVIAFITALCVGALLVWTAVIIIPLLLVLGMAGYLLVRGRRHGWRAF